MRLLRRFAAINLVLPISIVLTSVAIGDETPSAAEWHTNGPAIFRKTPRPGSSEYFNNTFDHYTPDSLNNLIWTNFIAHTNGRTMQIWSKRYHPTGWPAKPPVAEWNTNCLMWGMKGMTAMSPCWEGEGSSGQVPITALTRRHGYTRGHGMGPDGFNSVRNGMKVWFVARNNWVVQATIAGSVIRTRGTSGNRDYTIFLFSQDLPKSIEPIRVFPITTIEQKYTRRESLPLPMFDTEQTGNVSAGVEGFSVDIWKGGDSGSPTMLPMPGELIFLTGRTTTWPTAGMQADMDDLCRTAHLDPKKYQLQWLDLSGFPSF